MPDGGERCDGVGVGWCRGPPFAVVVPEVGVPAGVGAQTQLDALAGEGEAVAPGPEGTGSAAISARVMARAVRAAAITAGSGVRGCSATVRPVGPPWRQARTRRAKAVGLAPVFWIRLWNHSGPGLLAAIRTAS